MQGNEIQQLKSKRDSFLSTDLPATPSYSQPLDEPQPPEEKEEMDSPSDPVLTVLIIIM